MVGFICVLIRRQHLVKLQLCLFLAFNLFSSRTFGNYSSKMVEFENTVKVFAIVICINQTSIHSPNSCNKLLVLLATWIFDNNVKWSGKGIVAIYIGLTLEKNPEFYMTKIDFLKYIHIFTHWYRRRLLNEITNNIQRNSIVYHSPHRITYWLS